MKKEEDAVYPRRADGRNRRAHGQEDGRADHRYGSTSRAAMWATPSKLLKCSKFCAEKARTICAISVMNWRHGCSCWASRVHTVDEGKQLSEKLIRSGEALDKIPRDGEIAGRRRPRGRRSHAPSAGQAQAESAQPAARYTFSRSNASSAGTACVILGGGREKRKTRSIRRSALSCIRKSGTLYRPANRCARFTTIPKLCGARANALLLESFHIGERAPAAEAAAGSSRHQ